LLPVIVTVSLLPARPSVALPIVLRLKVAPLVVNDAIGPIRTGTDDGVGAAVVCGTGGAVGARNARGDVFGKAG